MVVVGLSGREPAGERRVAGGLRAEGHRARCAEVRGVWLPEAQDSEDPCCQYYFLWWLLELPGGRGRAG